jgi:glucan biosynthesis protein
MAGKSCKVFLIEQPPESYINDEERKMWIEEFKLKSDQEVKLKFKLKWAEKFKSIQKKRKKKSKKRWQTRRTTSRV